MTKPIIKILACMKICQSLSRISCPVYVSISVCSCAMAISMRFYGRVFFHISFHLSFSDNPTIGRAALWFMLVWQTWRSSPLRAMDALGEQQFISVVATQYRYECGLAALALRHWPSIGPAFWNMDAHGWMDEHGWTWSASSCWH